MGSDHGTGWFVSPSKYFSCACAWTGIVIAIAITHTHSLSTSSSIPGRTRDEMRKHGLRDERRKLVAKSRARSDVEKETQDRNQDERRGDERLCE